MSRSTNGIKKLKRLAGKQRWDSTDGRLAVQAWRESGLPMETFAREYGFGGWRLRWWASRVEESPSTMPTLELGHDQKFVPAVVTAGEHGHRVGPAIILRLPDGIEVEFRDVARVEPEEIGRLVAEVRRAHK